MAKDGNARLDANYVRNAAFHYLGRFNSSTANLRKILERKIWRRKKRAGLSDLVLSEEEAGWVEETIAACISYGYVDDSRYASDRAQGLLRKGKPLGHIKSDLSSKGIDGDIIETTLQQLADHFGSDAVCDHPDADQYAAARYVRRRRFGPYRRGASDADKDVQDLGAIFKKELASMARAGFSYEVAKKTLTLSQDDVLALIEGAELG